MFWPMLAVALGFTGFAVLAFFAVRLFVEVRRLSRTVAEAGSRLTAAASDLERAGRDLARTAGVHESNGG
ncbi:hypothetical protein ACN20G_22415 [Streptomyces sp. BI20]|uniref:hypothetical protein n=1 Tax=Streptomyces sp. BI20 TaxID=3403460 RepID=UPI003C74B3E0